MFCSPEDPCSSCIFMLFGGWGVLGDCSQSFGLWNFISADVKWEVAVCSPRSQRPGSDLCGVCGEHWGICSTAGSGEVPCHPSPGALDVAFLIEKENWLISPQTTSSSVEPSTRHGTGFPSSGEHHLDRYTTLQSLITQLHIFFHIQCQGWMWRGRSRLHGKLNLAFPQLQVTSSLLRWALLWRLVCIYIHTEAEYTYRNMHAVTLALQ